MSYFFNYDVPVFTMYVLIEKSATLNIFRKKIFSFFKSFVKAELS